ncbi:unnamed protein product, partial [Ectocarpus sp. 12 AP-2014]
GELFVVEASSEAASAGRGLSLVAQARGCSVTVLVCDEGEMLESMRTVVAEADSAKASTAAAATAVGKDGDVRPDEVAHRSARG